MDKRVQRTKKAIQNAFMSLLTEKSFDKITMKEVAAAASIDRKTLYNYYKNLDDLLEELENNLIDKFEGAIAQMKFSTLEDVKDAFALLNEHLKENVSSYTFLMKILKESFLASKTVAYLKGKVRMVLTETRVVGAQIELAVEFITYGMFAAYRLWFISDRTRPLEEFTADVARLVIGGTNAYFG